MSAKVTYQSAVQLLFAPALDRLEDSDERGFDRFESIREGPGRLVGHDAAATAGSDAEVGEIHEPRQPRVRPGCTIKGQGRKTILDFSEQTTGGNGIAVDGADGITFQDLTLIDTPGDGIRVEKTTGVTLRNIKVSWSAGSVTENGAYALYPVFSSRILVED